MKLDYAALGFKCGIECHQRLAAQKKLFCNCVGETSESKPVGEIRRFLRAVPSELGEYDPAALFEMQRNRKFIYQLFPEETCMVETDDEPPHSLNDKALDISLEIALLLHAKPVEEVHVMRKTVVDGSACSGFQRTALIALGGRLETSRGPLAIQTTCLEEESSGIVSSSPGEVIYRLDRQGIPLIEIATSSEIVDPEHAREVAEKLGALLRSTAKVQRGIGTIRQDLNISIKDGARVEVKGAQEPGLLPKLIENEVRRQVALVEIKEELKKRSVASKGALKVKPEVKDVSEAFRAGKCSVFIKALSRGERVMGLRLPGFKGLLGRELMPNHRFGTELFHYARAATGIQGIIHGDEDMRAYEISEKEVYAVEKTLGCSEGDSFVLCFSSGEKATAALEKVFERAVLAALEVPGETRKAEGEITVFLRPLPGPARMYPETDVPPVRVEKTRLEKISGMLPPTPEESLKKYLSWGLNKQLAERMLASTEFSSFEELVEQTKAEPTLIATTLLETLRSLRRKGLETEKISEEHLRQIFVLCAEGKIVEHAVPELLAEVAGRRDGVSVEEAVEKLGVKRASPEEVLKLVEEARKKGITDQKLFDEVIRVHRLRVAPQDLRKAIGL